MTDQDQQVEHHLETRGPADLAVQVGKGAVHVLADDRTSTDVVLTGRYADQVRVEQTGDRVTVVGPKHRGLLGGDTAVGVQVRVPAGSAVAVRTGSAAVRLEGPLGTTQVRSGSGDVTIAEVTGPTVVETGSGEVSVTSASADVRVKSGSGGVRVGRVSAALQVSTGSGDVEVGTADGSAVVKTGSGDLVLGESRADVSLSTGSGDLAVRVAHAGRLSVRGASGDVRVGVPVGTPVWTDISTVSGRIRSDLPATGAPAEGQPYVELRATTVSGDVVLAQA